MKDFLPFITDENGTSLDINNNGVIIPSVVPKPILDNPKGWDRNTIQFTRNNEFRGMIKAYTTPVSFFLKGAQILRHFYYTVGMEVVLLFIWTKLNISFGGQLKHQGWYKGEFDFSTIKDYDERVDIAIQEAGLYKDIQTSKGIMKEYAFKDNDDTVSLEMDGMDIQQRAHYIVTDGAVLDYNGQHTVDLPLISVEKIAAVTAQTVERAHFANNADLGALKPFMTTGNAPTDITIDSIFGCTVTLATGITPNPLAGSRLLVRYLNDANVAIGSDVLHSWGGASNLYGVHHTANIQTTVTAPANVKCYLIMCLTIGGVIAVGSGADEVVFWHYDNNPTDHFNLSYLYRAAPSVIDAFRVYDLGNQIIKKTSNNVSTLRSDLLENDFNLLVTSGDSIRGIPNAVVKTKLSDYHKSVDAVKCVSFGIEDNNARLETRRYAFQNSLISNLGATSKLVSEPANDYIYNSIVNGYPETDIGDVNGKYSFCNTAIYSTPVKRLENKYDIQSVYLADPYVIEIRRINLDGKTTTDSPNDNSVFFIDAEAVHAPIVGHTIQFIEGVGQPTIRIIGVTGLGLTPGTRFKVVTGLNAGVWTVYFAYESGGDTFITINGLLIDETIATTILFLHYKLRRKPYVTITGVPSPATIFNLELSPKTNLMNHYEWIHSALEKMDNKYLVYETTEKNDLVTRTDAAGVTIKEREDILIGGLGPIIYQPHILTFNAESPLNLVELMTGAGGRGYFAADTFNGFPLDVRTNDATQETQVYKLLVAAGTDLTTLIQR